MTDPSNVRPFEDKQSLVIAAQALQRGGYKGTMTDFLEELGVGGNHTEAVAQALTSKGLTMEDKKELLLNILTHNQERKKPPILHLADEMVATAEWFATNDDRVFTYRDGVWFPVLNLVEEFNLKAFGSGYYEQMFEQLKHHSYIHRVIRATKGCSGVELPPENLPNGFIPFKIGLLEWGCPKLQNHSPDYYLLSTRDENPSNLWNNGQEPTESIQLIKHISGGDAKVEKFLWAWAVFCLAGVDLKSRKRVLILSCLGGNGGRSTYCQWLKRFCGRTHQIEWGQLADPRCLVDRYASSRLIFIPELNYKVHGSSTQANHLKAVTGGDGWSGYKNHVGMMTYNHFQNFVITSNRLDIFAGFDNAFVSRTIGLITSPIPKEARDAFTDEHLHTLKSEEEFWRAYRYATGLFPNVVDAVRYIEEFANSREEETRTLLTGGNNHLKFIEEVLDYGVSEDLPHNGQVVINKADLNKFIELWVQLEGIPRNKFNLKLFREDVEKQLGLEYKAVKLNGTKRGYLGLFLKREWCGEPDLQAATLNENLYCRPKCETLGKYPPLETLSTQGL